MKTRKTLIVLADFQRWFLISFVLYVMAFVSVFAIGIYAYFQIVAKNIRDVAGLLSQTQMDLIERHLQQGLYALIGLVVMTAVIAGFYALIFSRRIAGPIFALSRHLDRCIESKKLEPLTLREGDLFKDIADRFNRLAEQILSERR
jgi:hypothetical protein